MASVADSRRKTLLAAHVTAIAGVVGADLALVTLGLAALGGADPATVFPAAAVIASGLVLPFALAALVTGIVLALVTRWGLLRYWWVTIKLVITVALTAAVLFVLVPGLEATAHAARQGAVARNPLLVGPVAASLLLFAALLLFVFKPAWRLRAHGRVPAPPARLR